MTPSPITHTSYIWDQIEYFDSKSELRIVIVYQDFVEYTAYIPGKFQKIIQLMFNHKFIGKVNSIELVE